MNFSVDCSSNNLSDEFPILYQNRYCDQEDFSIAVFGSGSDKNNRLYDKPFLLNNFDTKLNLPSVIKHKYGRKVISSGSDIYLIDKHGVGDTSSIKLYSSSTNNWKNLPSLNIPKISYCV